MNQVDFTSAAGYPLAQAFHGQDFASHVGCHLVFDSIQFIVQIEIGATPVQLAAPDLAIVFAADRTFFETSWYSHTFLLHEPFLSTAHLLSSRWRIFLIG
jgi:hypothetical protein